MKRLLLLPALMLGLSFACDQPYEEVAGIKIGCPVSELTGFDGYSEPQEYEGKIKIRDKYLYDGFFRRVVILDLNGKIIAASLHGANGERIDIPMLKILLDELQSRWGNISNLSSEDGIGSNYSIIPANNVIEHITISYNLEDQTVVITYGSTDFYAELNRLEEERTEEVRERFKGV